MSISMEMKASNLTSDETIHCLTSVNCKVLSVERQRYANLIKICLIKFNYKSIQGVQLSPLFHVNLQRKPPTAQHTDLVI